MAHLSLVSHLKETEAAIPWSEILTSAPVWSVVVTNFFFLASPEGINLSLPRYFKEVLGLSLAEVRHTHTHTHTHTISWPVP